MTEQIDTYSEQFRRETEAKTWLKRTKAQGPAVEALLKRIAERRGQAAADQLRLDMREELRRARTGAARSSTDG